MSDTAKPGSETETPDVPIMTKRDMLKALEPLGMDDSIIIAVYPPKDDGEDDESFSETETPGAVVAKSESDEDDRDYVECNILDSEIVEPDDPTDPEMVGKKALLLTVDLDVEMSDTEEGGEDDAEEPDAA